jgi:hypothetical protein
MIRVIFGGEHRTMVQRVGLFLLAWLMAATAGGCKRKRESTPSVTPAPETKAAPGVPANQGAVASVPVPATAPSTPVATKEQLIEQRIEKLRQQGFPTTLEELHRWEMIPAGETNLAPLLLEKLSTRDRLALPVRIAKRDQPLSPSLTNQLYALARNDVVRTAEFRKVLSTEGRARFLPSLAAPANPVPLEFMRHVSGQLYDDALWHLEAKRPQFSAMSVASLVRLAHFMAEEPRSIVQGGRVLLLDFAARGAERILHHAILAPAQLEPHQREFAREFEVAWRNAVIGEQCVAIVLLKTKGPTEQFNLLLSLDWGEETVSYRDLVELPAADPAQAFLDCLEAFDEMNSRLKEPMLKQWEAGKALAERLRTRKMGALAYLWAAHLGRFHFETNLKGLAIQRTAQAALAVERYRLANRGALPPTLDALVPTYLAAVPLDPFDDQPLRYKRMPKGFSVYSIGADLRDDGGIEGRLMTKAPCDLTFIIAR